MSRMCRRWRTGDVRRAMKLVNLGEEFPRTHTIGQLNRFEDRFERCDPITGPSLSSGLNPGQRPRPAPRSPHVPRSNRAIVPATVPYASACRAEPCGRARAVPWRDLGYVARAAYFFSRPDACSITFAFSSARILSNACRSVVSCELSSRFSTRLMLESPACEQRLIGGLHLEGIAQAAVGH